MQEPDPPEDSGYFNVPVDPSLCRLETPMENNDDSSVRILKLRFPHTWSYRKFYLPPPWFSRTEKLEFDCDSKKVVDEMRKAIVACLQQKQQIQTYKLRLDQIAPFYLVNHSGDVVLMTKDFLQSCPKPGKEMKEAPTFFVCGVKQSPNNFHQDSEPLPHFNYYSKDARASYLVRVLFLIVLSCLLFDLPGWSLQWSPYFPALEFNESKIGYVLLPLSMSFTSMFQYNLLTNMCHVHTTVTMYSPF